VKVAIMENTTDSIDAYNCIVQLEVTKGFPRKKIIVYLNIYKKTKLVFIVKENFQDDDYDGEEIKH